MSGLDRPCEHSVTIDEGVCFVVFFSHELAEIAERVVVFAPR